MRRILLCLSLLLITLSPVAHADTVSIPNTFVNGTPADAEQMNANFDEVEAAVNDNDARITAAQDTASAAAGAAGENSAAITALQGGVSSNAETISNLDAFANFLADDAEAAAFSVTAAQSTATTAQAASDANAALIAALEARITSLEAAQAPAASSYNCFVAGFCVQAAIHFPPGNFGYTNVYQGHSPGTEPALGAGCNSLPGATLFTEGARAFFGSAFFEDLSLYRFSSFSEDIWDSPWVGFFCASN